MMREGWALVAPWLRPLELVLVVIAATEPEGLELTALELGQRAAANPKAVRDTLRELVTLGLMEYRPASRTRDAWMRLPSLDRETGAGLLPLLVARAENLETAPHGSTSRETAPPDAISTPAKHESAKRHHRMPLRDTLLGDLKALTTQKHALPRPRARTRVEQNCLAACGRLPTPEEWEMLRELGALGLTVELFEEGIRQILARRDGKKIGSLKYFRSKWLELLGTQERSTIETAPPPCEPPAAAQAKQDAQEAEKALLAAMDRHERSLYLARKWEREARQEGRR